MATNAYAIDETPRQPRPLDAGLHVVATPIGNLRDITLRALDTLAAAAAIACEDTRVTGKLLNHYAIRTPMMSYHEHNAAVARPKILERLAAGEAIALVSDAGTPLISDPGFKLVEAAIAAGHAVHPAPGPSAPLAALVASGLPTDAFHFAGFLPPKQAARRARAEALSAIPATLVFFESGPRLAASLADLAAVLGARPAAVCRELTKLHEEIRRGALADLAAHYAEAPTPRGEIVLVIGAAGPPEPTDESEIDRLLDAALARASLKDAASEVARAAGLPRRDVYARALRRQRPEP